jgi:hypothetical protein
MKTGAYIVKQKTRPHDWPRLDRVSALILVLALTEAVSAQAALNTSSPGAVTAELQLVSVNRTGTNGSGGLNGGTGEYTISANGRFVAFTTFASDLVANDMNGGAGRQDVFIRDLQNKTTTLVSANRLGTDSGNDNSGSPSISADGRFVAFASSATDLVVTDITGGRGPNVFVRDMQTGITTLASVNRNGTDGGNGGSELPSLSADGHFVAFISRARDLVTNDTNTIQDVFVRDLQTGTTTLESVNRAGTGGGNSASGTPVLSADGRFVAFSSLSSDLVGTDTNGTWDVFVRDLHLKTTKLVSVNRLGTDSGNGRSGSNPTPTGFVLSPNGRFIAFESLATDLVAVPTSGIGDVFVRDLQTGVTSLASINRTGTSSGNGTFGSNLPAISDDGRLVTFTSWSSDLVPTDNNGTLDVFVRDLQMGVTKLVSVNLAGADSGNGLSYDSGISADGRFIAFSSRANNLVGTPDTNGGQPFPDSQTDVFLRDLQTQTTTLLTFNQSKTDTGNNGSGYPLIDTAGRVVVFVSAASDLVVNDTNGENDLYVAQITSAPTPTCSAAKAMPATLWSPNHQFVPIAITGVTDPDGDAVPITTTGVTQDEPVNGKGDGNTSPDAIIKAGAASVRAERSGKGNGRVYELSFTADDGQGGVCTGAVKVSVPHSLQKGATAIDDGQIYDSTIR